MIYCQTIVSEKIAVHPMGNVNDTQYIELIKSGNTSTFVVCIDDGDNEWFWEFDMTTPSNYELVKLTIFDMIHECDTMHELAYILNGIFQDGFCDILIEEEYE